jgi:hypothetical protein
MWQFCVEIIGTLRANESSGRYKMGATFCLSPMNFWRPWQHEQSHLGGHNAVHRLWRMRQCLQGGQWVTPE